jgi:crotonobetainyl-CoA:carnitine CoA-transferase CaiB-like acyl-CoA transferase
MTKTALAGLRVVELCGMIAGPYCTKVLADLGAEVLKVEEPARGDPARRAGPFPQDIPHPERSGLFLYLNTNKLGVTLDVATASGQRLLRELLRDADILVEDLPAGGAEAMGLSHEALAAAYPELIVTSITPFGSSGPYRDWRAYHLNLYHGSGHSSFIYQDPREAAKGPVVGGGYVGEYDAGLAAALAALAAVLGRPKTGRGQQVEVSKQEALVALERVDIGRFANDPTPVRRPGMVGGLVPCRDGYIVITAVQNQQWQGLMEVMGNPAWAQGEMCRDEISRSLHRDELQPYIEDWAAGYTAEEIYRLGQQANVPVGPVRSVAEVMAWEQARQRGFFAGIEHPEAGRLEYPTAAYQFSETPWRVERPAPLLGEHNDEIYCGRLGYSRRDLVRLSAAGVI